MAILITTVNAGNILLQSGHGVPVHVAPKGSHYTDVDTAIMYINKDGLNTWAINIDSTNSGTTSSINSFSYFSAATIGQNVISATTSTDTISFSGININILTDEINKIITFSADSSSNYTFTGGTVTGDTNFTNGLTANTISATTYYNLPKDIYVTGSTYDDLTGVATFTNTTGGTFNLSGLFKSSDDIYTTGLTFNPLNYDLNITRNDGTSLTQNLAILASDMTITGGTYNSSNGVATFTNNTGGTFTVSGFLTGMTDTYVTGFTYSDNLFTVKQNGQSDLTATINSMTGLTVNGGLSATTISANTINLNDYIDFNTGTTTPTISAGRVFYDNETNSLAYYSDIFQNVKVELGQQLYIRGYNNTSNTILKGTALSIQSATNGLPNFTPAVNIHSGLSQVIGLAASDINVNSVGLALSQGILSGLTVNTFNVGDILYASPFSAGAYVSTTDNFPFSARTNQIGFVIATGSTEGKIYVSINNEDDNLTLTDIERNILEGNVISTGIYEFTGITNYSTTTINVAPMRGWLVRNTYDYTTKPDVTNLFYTGGTNISLPNLLTADSTYLLVNSGSTLYQQTTYPTPQQRRENIYLGKINHPNRSTISSINNTPDFDVSPMSAIRDLWVPIKLINQGVLVSPNGANLNINISSGTLWGNGIGWISNQLNPDSVTISGSSPTTFQYRTQTGGTFSNTTVIDVSHYDLNGVVTAVGGGAGSSTNQRVYLFPTGLIRIQYGQIVYGNLASAISAAQTESFVEYPNHRDNAILIGIISVNKSATLLNNISQATFTLVSKFGELLGGTGGVSTTTLQQAYDNSSSPEITINSTLDGLSIKNGTGNADNITRLIEGINSTNNVTSFIRSDGYISGTTFQSNSFIANNGGATATTFNILTLGSGSSINNLGVDINGRVVIGSSGGSTFTGGTVTGATNFTNGLTANTISATTYYNLPIDVRVTGGTYNGANITFVNNTGGTFNVTGLTATGFSSNYYGSFSDNTNQPVSGVSTPTLWTYNQTEISNGISVIDNSKITVNNKGVYEIGYSVQLEKTQGTEADVTIWATINGTSVARSSSTTSLVSNSSLQLPFVSYIFELEANDYVQFYFSSASQYVQLKSLSGLTTPTRPDSPSVIIVAKQVGLSVTDNLGGYYLPLSGGTVTGGTAFNNGITATTISATTYYNLPTDIRVTGGTYSNGSILFTNNAGGTFSVTGLYTGYTASTDIYTTGGTYSNTSGITTFTNNTGGTFNVTGYYTGYNALTGATYSNNVITFTDNTGNTSSLLINTMTGLTVNGDLFANSISATTYYNLSTIVSATTVSATTYYNLTDAELDTKIFGYRVNLAAQKAYKTTQTIAGNTMTTGTINGESIYCQKFYAHPNEKINEIVFRIMTAGAAGLGLAQARLLIYRTKLNANNEIIGGDLELDTNVNINTLTTGLKVVTGLNHTLSSNTYKNVWYMCIRNYQSGSLSLKFYTTADIVSKLYDLSVSSSAAERDLGWYFTCLYTSPTPASMPLSASTAPSTTAVASTSALVAIGYSNS